MTNNNTEDSTLIDLYNQAIRDNNQESKEALIARWKKLCDLLDSIEE